MKIFYQQIDFVVNFIEVFASFVFEKVRDDFLEALSCCETLFEHMVTSDLVLFLQPSLDNRQEHLI